MLRFFVNHKYAVIILLIITLLLFYKPIEIAPFWFDEGWTLSVARNWVEFGHYGERNAGQFVPSTILNSGFPCTALYALTFRLFGVGPFQARAMGNLIVIICFMLLYVLAIQLFSKQTAVLTLLIALTANALGEIHPLLRGRQALGEMPMLMYVLCGFVTLILFASKNHFWVSITSLFFALALQTKPQVMPFLMFGIMYGLLIAFMHKDRHNIVRFTWLIVATILLYILLGRLWSAYLNSLSNTSSLSTDPYSMVRDLRTFTAYVFVLDPFLRIAIPFQLTLGNGLSGFLGILGVSRKNLEFLTKNSKTEQHTFIHSMLWGFCASWYAWWLFLSIGWPRYIMPALFLSSVITAQWLVDVFEKTRWPLHALDWRHHDVPRVLTNFRFIVILGLFYQMVLRSTLTTADIYSRPRDALIETVRYLNAHTTTTSLIETYESELFFLLDSNYHYPPDEVQHAGNERLLLSKQTSIEYNFEMLSPQFIVLGKVNTWWGMYDDISSNSQYALVYENDPYQVYERIE